MRRREGRVVVSLESVEVALLVSLLDELDQLLAAPAGTDDEVLDRLFPSAHPDDDAAEAEFRELTEASLRADRGDRIGSCRAELAAVDGGDLTLDLTDADASRRWIQVLNDLRLALGTRLGISADDEHRLDPDDPPRLVYHWLTTLQDGVVTAVMG